MRWLKLVVVKLWLLLFLFYKACLISNQIVYLRPTSFFALVLAPARELVVQIADHFRALGAKIGLKVAVIIGNMDLKSQVKLLNSNPHIVVGTPGKVLYHM